MKVIVHGFWIWDGMSRKHTVPPRKRQKEQIARMGGEIIPGTAQRVDTTDLDGDGGYGLRAHDRMVANEMVDAFDGQ